jgi:hypothetical protein
MAVVRSGGGSIVSYSRGLVGVYYALVATSGVIAVLCLLATPGMVETGTWTHKLWTVVSWILGVLSFAMMAIQLYTMTRAYARTYVAIGLEGVRINVPTSGGTLLVIDSESPGIVALLPAETGVSLAVPRVPA